MSILLRQPHGFEGVLPLLTKAAMHDAPVTDRPHKGRAHCDLDSIPAPVIAGIRRRYLIASFGELVYLGPNGFPQPEELVQEGAYLIKFEYAAHRADCAGEVELEVRVQLLERALPVSPVDGVANGPHDLQVLLRHRPRSIPQAGWRGIFARRGRGPPDTALVQKPGFPQAQESA